MSLPAADHGRPGKRDGTAEGATRRASCRARGLAARCIPAHNASRTVRIDNNCRVAEKPGIGKSGSSGKAGSRPTHEPPRALSRPHRGEPRPQPGFDCLRRSTSSSFSVALGSAPPDAFTGAGDMGHAFAWNCSGKLCESTLDAPPGGLPLGQDVVEPAIAQPLPHDHHHVCRRPSGADRSESLPHQALRAIALDGVADATRGHDTEPRSFAVRRAIQHEDEPGRYHAPPTLLNAQEFGAFSYTIAGRKPTRWPGFGHGGYFLVLAAVTAKRQRPRRRRF
jgi:hypothetical protein